ncbi:MAG: esterase, partial [Christiangramia sp.]|nr:esterase [Christiangramia sp.]
MRKIFLFLLIVLVGLTGFAQESQVEIKEDFIPSSKNQPGKEFPKVNSEGRVRVRIEAPKANKVQLDIGGV